MTSELQIQITVLFLVLFVIGTMACLPLYAWSPRTFFASSLWTKVYWWIPIFAGFSLVLWYGVLVAEIVCLVLLWLATREFLGRQAWRSPVATAYGLAFLLALPHLVLIAGLPKAAAVSGLVSICFASALSDVMAFFAGNFAGRHHLPDWINPHKSWEGVAGQILGSLLGIGLVSLLPSISFSWSLAVVVGIASAIGDITNSIAKRRLGIREWGNTIPGHGGVLDRFSSLSFALAASYYLLR